MDTLIEFGKILLPAALVLYAMYLGVKVMIARELTKKELELRHKYRLSNHDVQMRGHRNVQITS